MASKIFSQALNKLGIYRGDKSFKLVPKISLIPKKSPKEGVFMVIKGVHTLNVKLDCLRRGFEWD